MNTSIILNYSFDFEKQSHIIFVEIFKISMSISFFIGSFISLFALINPLSALPVFISLTRNYDSQWKKLQVRKTCVYIFIICICAYFAGSHILEFFGISINALKIAGGIVISRSGFLLLNAKHKKDVQGKVKKESMEKEDISFSPLAMPLLAGPGSISLLINMWLEYPQPNSKFTIVLAIICVVLSIYVLFSIAPRILQYTGEAGLKSLSKIMGFLVLAIGIEMIAASVIDLLKTI